MGEPSAARCPSDDVEWAPPGLVGRLYDGGVPTVPQPTRRSPVQRSGRLGQERFVHRSHRIDGVLVRGGVQDTLLQAVDGEVNRCIRATDAYRVSRREKYGYEKCGPRGA